MSLMGFLVFLRIITKNMNLMKSIFTILTSLLCALNILSAQNKVVLIKDINQGFDSSLDLPVFVEYKGSAYFVADDGANDEALWKSDGTTTGTIRFKDLAPSIPIGRVSNLIVYDNKLFFITSNNELWRTDGTSSGTSLVKSFAVPPGGIYSFPAPVIFKNKLWFVVRNPATDASGELVYSDGTAAGTKFFRKTDSTQAFIKNPVIRMVTDSILYVTGDVSSWGVGIEVIKTDGTIGGTSLLKDVIPGIEGMKSSNFFMHNDGQKLYFNAPTNANVPPRIGKLWVTDGTIGGTQQVTTSAEILSKDIVTYKGSTFFNAYDPTMMKSALWQTTGSGLSAQPFQDSRATGMSVFNDELYFMQYQNGFYKWNGVEKRYLGPSTIVDQYLSLVIKPVVQQDRLYYLVRQRDDNSSDTSDVIIVSTDTVQYLSALVSGYQNVTQIAPFGKSLIMALDKTDTGQEPYLLTSTVSINNIEYAALELFPNPIGSQMLTITVPARGSLEVYDIFGRIVASAKFDSVGQQSIPIDHLLTGCYLVQLKGDEKVYTGKIVKQ